MHRKPGFNPLLPFRIGWFIRKGKFNIIHTHNEAGLIYGASGAFCVGIKKVVHTEHGKEPGHRDRKLMMASERILLRTVKKIVAVSEDLGREVAEGSRIDKGRIQTVLNGIDIGYYKLNAHRDDVKMRLGLTPGSFVVGHIARLVPLKNQIFLLTLFKKLSERFANLKLVVVGSGPLRSELENFCTVHGLAGRVYFLGARQDIPELLSVFDLFLLPSLTEGISVTLLEAMAAGVPVIASRVGGKLRGSS